MQLAPVSRFVRHEHLVVTVEADTKERIDADLGAGESLEAWVADAVERKLDRETAGSDSGPAGSGPDRSGSTDSGLGSEFADITDLGEGDSDSSEATSSDRADGDGTESGDEPGRTDEYDEGFEYVDDCAI
jgi:hypothetical protein